MIILLYGKDNYRKKIKEKEIISSYNKKHKSGLNIKSFDFSKEDISIKEILSQSFQGSIFKEKKLIIISNSFSKKEEIKKEIKKIIETEDIFLLLEEEIKESDSLLKKIKESSSYQLFDNLKGLKLKKWIEEEFKKLEKEIEERELSLFSSLVLKKGSWEIYNEILKVSNFSEKKIREEDIRVFLKEEIDLKIFDTIEAISEKKEKEAIKLLRNHIEKGENPIYILSMINYQFRNIIIIKDLIDKGYDYAKALKETKMNPFVFRKSYYQSLNFSTQKLRKIYSQLSKIDLDIKTGKTEKEAALELFIAFI